MTRLWLHDAAPSSEIILYLPHNLEQTNIPGSNAVRQTYVDEMRSIAAAHRARVVDGFASISLAGRQCELTLLCTPDDDPHLSDAGYAFLGHMFFSAAGYGRLRG